jgi:hypothetical protein
VEEVQSVLLLLVILKIVLLPLDLLLDDARPEEVFFHKEVTVVGDEYQLQLFNFSLVVFAEGISVTQTFCYVISCLTFSEKFLIGLALERVYCLKEAYNVA